MIPPNDVVSALVRGASGGHAGCCENPRAEEAPLISLTVQQFKEAMVIDLSPPQAILLGQALSSLGRALLDDHLRAAMLQRVDP